MDYPDNCLRGIPNKSFIVEGDGSIGAHLFYFEKKFKREDGLIEQSINWDDEDATIDFTLNQKKENGELQFQAGVAIISREEIDRLSKNPNISGFLSYERQPLEGNPYHGNFLLQENVPIPTMKKIAAAIALYVSKVVYRD